MHTLYFTRHGETVFKAIRTLVAEKEVGALVYGLPLQMNGEEGDQCRSGVEWF